MGKFSLMALPYEADALQPVISKDTISFHHGKHLAAYVNNLTEIYRQDRQDASGQGHRLQ